MHRVALIAACPASQIVFVLAVWCSIGLSAEPSAVSSTDEQDRTSLADDRGSDDWVSLFDGDQLGQWKPTPFGGEGEVHVEDGEIRIARGSELSGITWQGEFPKDGYELAVEACRVDGHDFFCGLTFPIGDEPCSLIVGGWGGGVVGLSSIDGADAAHNDTTLWREFEQGRWYRITVQVTSTRIRCSIDDEQVIDQAREGHRFSIRPEVFLSRPLGVASYGTLAAVRDLRYRPIDPASLANDGTSSAPVAE